MSRISSLVIFTVFSLLAIPASAQTVVSDTPQGVSSDNGPVATPDVHSGPTILGYAGIGSAYPYQDFGFYASTHPVVYGGTTFTWKSGDSLDFWVSQGAGGAANEIDVSYWHNGSFDSPLGHLDYQAKVAYYFLSGGGRNYLSSFIDDALYTHFDVWRTFDFGRLSVSLHSKTEVVDGTNNTPFFIVERVGVPVDWKFSDTVSGEVEFAHAWTLTGNAMNPWELTPKLVWQPGETSFILKDKMAEVHHQVVNEVMIEADFPL